MALCALLGTAAKAQIAPDINLGIKVGGNFNQIDGKYFENGYKANLLAGAYASVNWLTFGGQVEAFFTQATYTTGNNFYEGFKSVYNNARDSAKGGSFRVSYLTIPVLANFNLIPRVRIQAGPQFSGVVSVKDKDNLVRDAKKLFESNDIAGVVGVWVDLPAHLNVGARYVFGFKDINASNVGDSWKNRTLQLHIGYQLF